MIGMRQFVDEVELVVRGTATSTRSRRGSY